ncbi:MAG: beta-propeller domain-containing protein, partial [Solirubrobacteraceae bacterium]|nr:beta-propeller domain-containing protein [Solirubrobacteraceae bacterium]
PGGLSAEFDPHAFLWWPKTQLALLPYGGPDPVTYRSAAAAIGVTASRAGLEEVGRITHGPEWDRGDVVRSMIVGDRVITVSELGIATSALSGLGPVDFQAFVAAG